MQPNTTQTKKFKPTLTIRFQTGKPREVDIKFTKTGEPICHSNYLELQSRVGEIIKIKHTNEV